MTTTVDLHPLKIRPATPSDLEAILAIAEQSPEAPSWPPGGYSPYLTPDRSNPVLIRTAIIASLQGKIRGYAAATVLLDGEQNICQLDSIAVDPGARRHGVATALLRAICRWAAQNSAGHLSLEVRSGNAPAIAFYQQSGLVEEGRRPHYYAHPEEDALLLGIPLP
jgi:ribosomal-protein-alanine N-acetyltransferase